MQRRKFFAAGTAALAGAATADVGHALATAAGPVAAPTRSFIPNVPVLDQDGRAFRFYDDLVRDRTVMVNFFYTSCGETCPLVTENLRAVQDMLGERVGRDILMLSVSLQPELETPSVLKDYAGLWDVRPGWKFLTGAPEGIEELRKAMGFASANPAYDKVKDNHTGILRYGNDRRDRWAGTAGLGRPAWIVKAVTALADA